MDLGWDTADPGVEKYVLIHTVEAMPGWALVVPALTVENVEIAPVTTLVGKAEVAFFPDLKRFHAEVVSNPEKAMNLLKKAMESIKP